MDQAERLRNMVKASGLASSAEQKDDEKKAELENVFAELEESIALPEKKQAKVITITSGKGGVGKSSVSVNLAIQLRKQGKEVIIFDADFGLANVEVMFGAVPKHNLADVIYKGKNIKDIIVNGPYDIKFVSGGSGISGLGNMSREQVMYLVEAIKELEKMADILIIDTGAGISDSVIEFVLSSQEVLLVTTPEPTSITDSYALLKTLNARAGEESPNIVVKLIANRVNSKDEALNLYTKLNVVVNKFLKLKLEFLGLVPWDQNMSRSVMQQKPISISYPDSEGAVALVKIADKLMGKIVKEDDDIGKKKGIAMAIMKMFKNRKNES